MLGFASLAVLTALAPFEHAATRALPTAVIALSHLATLPDDGAGGQRAASSATLRLATLPGNGVGGQRTASSATLRLATLPGNDARGRPMANSATSRLATLPDNGARDWREESGVVLRLVTLPGNGVGGRRTANGVAFAPTAEPTQAAKGGSDHVDGRVVRRIGKGVQPVPNTWVTLHRVGSDTAGPLDSMRTTADGRYVFRYNRTGDPQAIYFVSSMFGGVAYFSQPLRAAIETGDDAQITVFDTTSTPIALTLRGRHLIIAAPGQDGLRTLVEVFEISNDSSRTLVAGGANGERPTWTTILPANATRFRVGQGDVPADAVTATNGRVEVFAPFAPGVKQFSISFALPQSDFPLSMPIEHATGMLEALAEEPATQVRSPALAPTAPVTVQGQTFQRFVGENTPSNGVIQIEVPAPPVSGQPIYMAALIAVVGSLLLLGLARAFTRPPLPAS